MVKKLVRGGLVFVGIVLITGVIGFLVLNKAQPDGQPGQEADQLGEQMMTAINHGAWAQTGAVSWNFAGRQQHLWDRARHFCRVRWDDVEVFVDLSTKQGLAWQAGQAVTGDSAGELLEKAWAFWANDSFWLNPVSKSFDEGVSRSLVAENQLLVQFGSGGVTPGDSYLWELDEDGLPRAWQMWVSILPIGGLEASWEGWQVLDTGVKVATRHKILFLTLELTDIRAAANLSELTKGKDPFLPLVNHLAGITTSPDVSYRY